MCEEICVSLSPLVAVESIFIAIHGTVSKYYVRKRRNQINKWTAIYVLLNRYKEKIFGKLGLLPALYYV